MKLARLRSPLLAAFVLGAALPLAPIAETLAETAAESDAESDEVLARVDGREIRRSDVDRAAEVLPPQMQGQIEIFLPMLVERLVDLEVVHQAAVEAGYPDKEQVLAEIAAAHERIVRDAYIEDVIDAASTEEALDAQYQLYLAENPPQEEIHARHILLESEEDAKAVIEALEGGSDFVELAKERSTGPSGPQGGDLGYFSRGMMVPVFEDAAFSLEPGQFSKEPVQSQFGWHVIQVEDARTQEPPARAAVEEELRDAVARTAIEERIAMLRKDAEVEILLPEPAEGGEGADAPSE